MSEPKEVDDASILMKRALGGWRGFVATALPSLVFVVTWVITFNLNLSLILALITAAVAAVVQLILRDTLQHVINGLIGIAISAAAAKFTGKPEDAFLPGLVINVSYGTVYLIGQLIRKPILGFVIGGLLGDLTSWLKDPAKVKAAWIAGWFWVGLFVIRMVVQTPLYLAGEVAALGFTRVIMGWPGFLLVTALSYKVMRPAFTRSAE
ncbi:MAG: DUF3159 domain-containing protein [Actinomycetota bacterium]|nr:DUF3159 domain-containing protein [Actinomycetota bacterium]